MRPLLRYQTALRSAARSSRALPACYAARPYSIKAGHASKATHQALDASKLQITKTTKPKTLPPPENLIFGREFTGRSIGLFQSRNAANQVLLCRSYAHRRVE